MKVKIAQVGIFVCECGYMEVENCPICGRNHPIGDLHFTKEEVIFEPSGCKVRKMVFKWEKVDHPSWLLHALKMRRLNPKAYLSHEESG